MILCRNLEKNCKIKAFYFIIAYYRIILSFKDPNYCFTFLNSALSLKEKIGHYKINWCTPVVN